MKPPSYYTYTSRYIRTSSKYKFNVGAGFLLGLYTIGGGGGGGRANQGLRGQDPICTVAHHLNLQSLTE